ncbi:hypothetical protein GEM_4593 [Burkholderia cepacia GG4]|uniref:Lipoprotein n=2 Tax=Burkholderia cepacia TaxID=292 RepID=A0A9W3K589_BURCE|nr:hypothetical protein GEM_4593 [Burkholderia cepacia GG4]
MQRYSFRHLSRAVFAGILIAGLAAGAGCQKKSDTGTGASSDTSATGGMSAAPSAAPSGTPGSGAAGSGADSGTTGGAASMPGAASAPTGASGG